MIHWVNKALVLAIHDRQLAEHGGQPGVRDQALLDSALARPRQTFAYSEHPTDLAILAASLAYGLARNHPFVDGNKRTAHVAYRTFLLLNGADLDASQQDLYVRMIGLAAGTLGEAEFAAWLRTRIVPDPEAGLSEETGVVHDSSAGYRD